MFPQPNSAMFFSFGGFFSLSKLGFRVNVGFRETRFPVETPLPYSMLLAVLTLINTMKYFIVSKLTG